MFNSVTNRFESKDRFNRTISAPVSAYAGTIARLHDSVYFKTALKVSDFDDDKDAFRLYKESVYSVQVALTHIANCAKRNDPAGVGTWTSEFYARISETAKMFNLCINDTTTVQALLPHVGSFRKVSKDSEEYCFLPAGEESFRKAFERTFSDMYHNGKLLTVEERKAMRKAREKAAREAKKAAANN